MNNDYYMKDWSSGESCRETDGKAGGDAVRKAARDAESTPEGCRETKLPCIRGWGAAREIVRNQFLRIQCLLHS